MPQFDLPLDQLERYLPTLEIPADDAAFWRDTLANGYSTETGYPTIDALVSRGGMSSMLYTVWLILSAMSFGAIMDYTGSLRKLLEPLVRFATTAGRLMISDGVTAIFLNIFAGDQYMAIGLPSTLFREEFKKRRVAPQMLSRQI
jgi:NhaC family Na+:H+ antiporter